MTASIRFDSNIFCERLWDSVCESLPFVAAPVLSDEIFQDLIGRVKRDPVYQLQRGELSILKERLKGHQEELIELCRDLVGSNEEAVKYLLNGFDAQALARLAGIEGEELAATRKMQAELREVALGDVTRTRAEAILREVVPEAVQFIHHLIEIFISTLGFNDLGAGKHNPYQDNLSMYEARAKIEMFTVMLGYPSAVFACCYAYLGNSELAVAATAFVIAATIFFIAVYSRYLKPCPQDCMGMTNLTKEVLRKNEVLFWRKDIHDRMQDIFRSRKAVLLVGPPGIGKNSIIESFAQRLAFRRIGSNDFIKKAQIFGINTAALCSLRHDSGFDLIDRRFHHYRDEVIFFLDELHAAFKGRLDGDAADELKDFCNRFPYIIGATTTDEYEEFFTGQKAINRRFEVIHVDHLSDAEMRSALYETAAVKAPELDIEAGFVEKTIQDAKAQKQTAPIDAAITTLTNHIAARRYVSFSALEKEIYNLELKVKARENAFLTERKAFDPAVHKQEKERLEKKRAKLGAKLNLLAQIQRMQTSYVAARAAAIRTASGPDEVWIRNFVLQKVMKLAIAEKQRLLKEG